MTALLSACSSILTQLEEVIGKISDKDFSRPLSILGGSTIGQHVRHTLEFFLCLRHGIRSGVVNYDKRARDRRIEKSRMVAMECIESIRNFAVSGTDATPLKLEVCYGNSDTFSIIPTSLSRELAYNVEHATHHMAIIKIGIKEIAPYLELPEHFGVAVSTVRHERKSVGLVISSE